MSKCGVITIMGRPNAGKSTLLNALIGQKIAAVSAKPQTTRQRVRGVVTLDESQLVFSDTPGLHRLKTKKSLNSYMNREAWSGIKDADMALYLVSLEAGLRDDDLDFLRGVFTEHQTKPLLLLATKADMMKKDQVKQKLAQINQKFSEVFPEYSAEGAEGFLSFSAKRPEDLSSLTERLRAICPEGEWLFPEDLLSDQPREFLARELISEHLFRSLAAEVPYETTVIVESWQEQPTLVHISALILVARESLKPMVIGKGGQKIKEIGTQARLALEDTLGTKVHLELNVKVSADWDNDLVRVEEYHGST